MADTQAVLYALLAIAVAIYVVRWRTHPLNAIPAVGGPSAPLLSFYTSFNMLIHGKKLIMEGYQKYHGSAFKIALPDQWVVVMCGSRLLDEMRKLPDEDLSFHDGIEALLQTRFTLRKSATDNSFHVDIIREKLMRTLVAVMPDVVDELMAAISDYIPVKENNEWVTINALESVHQMVARTSNRAFVGLGLCRNEEYLKMAIQFAFEIVKDKLAINMIPLDILKVAFGKHLSSARKSIREASPLLLPIIRERRAQLQEHGDEWQGKANDLLQWTLEQAIHRADDDEAIVERILLTNFASIHSTASTLTQALFDLAANPEYLQPLREEIEPIVAEHGWQKAALHKMYKVDSFIKESLRMNGITLVTMTRITKKDIAFSDGTVIPKDTVVVGAMYPMHHDEEYYPNAAVFDPFRFSRMREQDGEGTKHQLVHTSVEFSPWSHGKHSCPGRFFAANELKAMLAYIAVDYDIKIAGDGRRPVNENIAITVTPNAKAEIMLRKRQPSV